MVAERRQREDTQGKHHVGQRTEVEIGVTHLTAKECQRLLSTTKDVEETLP